MNVGIKDMKVSSKLLLGFGLIAFMVAAVGAVGIIGMGIMEHSDNEMYSINTKAIEYVGYIREGYRDERVALRDMVIAAWQGDKAGITAAETELAKAETKVADAIKKFEALDVTNEVKDAFEAGGVVYSVNFSETKDKVSSAVQAGNVAGALAVLATGNVDAAAITEALDKTAQANMDEAGEKNGAITDVYWLLVIILAAVFALAVVAAIVLGVYNSALIAKPMNHIMIIAKQAGERGDLHFSDKAMADIKADALRKDEIGMTINSFLAMINQITYKSQLLEKVADFDLTIDVKKVSDSDTLGNSMELMVTRLKEVFAELSSVSEQVSLGANQIADSSQALAQGATEQASSVEELTASINEISGRIQETAQNSDAAKMQSIKAVEAVENSNQKMEHMIGAMQEISGASGEIGKIIKTIEDIAFQTNILALNAAVEAARAGAAGKGFAVVADEVRNLASKSAEAAQNTTQLIESSISAVQNGTSIANETAKALMDIVESAKATTDLVLKINQASSEEAVGISQIKTGMDQISSVVQVNSATSEESAAAAEELSGQADMLKTQVNKVKLDETNLSAALKNSYINSNVYEMPVETSLPVAAAPAETGFPVASDPGFIEYNDYSDKY